MTVQIPVCIVCKHYRGKDDVNCDAFPDRIPDEIWLKGNLHDKPFPNDRGIQFEQVPGELTPAQLRL